MCHSGKLHLHIVVTDRHGRVACVRDCYGDLLLRNWSAYKKNCIFNQAVIAADGMKDVNSNARAFAPGVGTIPYGMLGNGAIPETSADIKIQAPLYVTPDPSTVGIVSLGGGNQVTLAVISAHTFAAATGVTEAGLFIAQGSTLTYLTNGNTQITRNTFANVPVGIGGTFTGTYTFTDN